MKHKCNGTVEFRHKADPSDRLKASCTQILPINTIADPSDRLKFFTPLHVPIMKFDVQSQEDDGKLGFGFTSADDLEEVDIGPGVSHDQLLSAKS